MKQGQAFGNTGARCLSKGDLKCSAASAVTGEFMCNEVLDGQDRAESLGLPRIMGELL